MESKVRSWCIFWTRPHGFPASVWAGCMDVVASAFECWWNVFSVLRNAACLDSSGVVRLQQLVRPFLQVSERRGCFFKKFFVLKVFKA